MINPVHPALIYFLGAIVILLIPGKLRKLFAFVIPLLALIDFNMLPPGIYWKFHFLEYELIFGRIDNLSIPFGYIFVIIGLLGTIYALHIKEAGQHVAAFIYIGSSMGVVLAGDFFSLFVFWEIMAGSSVFLIWYQRQKASLDAGFRYIMVHIFGGACLLAGILFYLATKKSIVFNSVEPGFAYYMIMIGFGLNAAIPPLHAWLTDSYPEGTVTGSVFLSAFTTKAAVYVLARGFPGVELLAWLGAVMAVYGVIFAAIENDIRRILAYHIVSQVGYMVCGIGLGTEIAISGSTAHAFSHILYKALLFMGAGSVIYMTGKRKLTELGGLSKVMPITLILYMVGAFSISGIPGFNGFISKSMVVTASALSHQAVINLLLNLASIGTFLSVGLKLPYYTFFSSNNKNKETKIREVPFNMILGMSLTAFLCIFMGVYPKVLYDILPYQVDYHPFTLFHISGAFQLLMATGLGFVLFIDYLKGKDTITLDVDWFYRKFGRVFLWACSHILIGLRDKVQEGLSDSVITISKLSSNPFTALEIVLLRLQLWYYKNILKLQGNNPNKKVRLIKERLEEISSRPYNENVYRRSIGLGVILSVLFLFLFSLIFILKLK